MGGCCRGICIWLETITLEDAPWLYVGSVLQNDLKPAGVKRYVEMTQRFFFPPGQQLSQGQLHSAPKTQPVLQQARSGNTCHHKSNLSGSSQTRSSFSSCIK